MPTIHEIRDAWEEELGLTISLDAVREFVLDSVMP